MTVPSTTNRWDYDGTGATDTYPYGTATTKIYDATDLQVISRVDSTGAETVLAYPDDYSVTGVGITGGGNVVLTAGNLAAGVHITIRIVLPLTQKSDIANQGGFFPETHEDALDRLTLIAQQIDEQAQRTVRFASTVDPAGHSFEVPYGSEGKFLAVSAGGDIAASAGTGADAGLRTDLADGVTPGNGAALVAYLAPGAGAVQTTVKNRLDVDTWITDMGASTLSADNSTEINAAIDAVSADGGGLVGVPRGTFNYSQITLKDNVYLVGPGTLKLVANANASATHYSILAAAGTVNTGLLHLVVDGNAANQGAAFDCNAIHFQGVDGFHVDHNVFQNWRTDAIECSSPSLTFPAYDPTDADTPPAPGALASEVCKNGTIHGNRFDTIGDNTAATGSCAQVDAFSYDISITGNVCTDVINGIVVGFYTRNISVCGNQLYTTLSNADRGISFEQMSFGGVCDGNTIHGTFTEGLQLESVFNWSGAGNTIRGCVHGVNGFASSINGNNTNQRTVSLTGTTIADCTAFSLRFVASGTGDQYGINIAGLMIDNPTTAAIQLYNITHGSLTGFDITGGAALATTGLDIRGLVDFVIGSGTINGVTAEGIYADDSSTAVSNEDVRLHDINVLDCGTYGLQVAGTPVSIRGHHLTITGSGTEDVNVASAARNFVEFGEGCVCETSTNATPLYDAAGELDVSIGSSFILNGTHNVDGFTPAVPNKTITLIQGDANVTTFKHAVGTAPDLYMRSGADATLAQNKTAQFWCDGTNWYEVTSL